MLLEEEKPSQEADCLIMPVEVVVMLFQEWVAYAHNHNHFEAYRTLELPDIFADVYLL